MGGFSGGASTGGGGGVGPAGITSSGSYGTAKNARSASGRNEFSSAAKKVAKFVATGGITGAIIRAITSGSKKNPKEKTTDPNELYSDKPTFREGGEGNNNLEGIELAKASTGSATILGPGEIQKEAANNVKGPTTIEMSADQILLANKRKGRRSTNITAKKTLANNYTLSTKTLLG